MATDLAEFLGAALGIKLLLHIPLFPAAVITGVITFMILGLQRYGFRPLEAVITAFVAVIGICYLGELWFAHPPLGEVAKQFCTKGSELMVEGRIGTRAWEDNNGAKRYTTEIVGENIQLGGRLSF